MAWVCIAPLTTGSVEGDPSYDTPSLAWSL